MATDTILLVNGARDVRKAHREVLEQAGYHVVEADSADQAVEFARRDQPRIILIEASGAPDLPLKLTLRLRRHPRTTRMPILVLSCDGVLEDADELGRLDVDSLSGPMRPHWLLEELQYLTTNGGPAAQSPQTPISASGAVGAPPRVRSREPRPQRAPRTRAVPARRPVASDRPAVSATPLMHRGPAPFSITRNKGHR